VATAREKRVVRDDASHYDILVSASPLRDADGQIIGAVATFTDISQRKRAEEAEREHREWLRVTLTSIGDAVIAMDTAARVTFLNPTAANLTGWTQEEAAGQPIGRVFPVINEKTRQPADDVVAQALRDKRVIALANDTALVAKDGREVPVEDSAAPILDAGGNVVGVVLVFHDVTAKRQAQEVIRRQVEELRASNEELARFNAAMVDRELRMVELKKEVNGLCARLGDSRPYPLDFTEEQP
jgi:PAS domain S-box-containing protein